MSCADAHAQIKYMRAAAAEGAKLILFPEGSVHSLWCADSPPCATAGGNKITTAHHWAHFLATCSSHTCRAPIGLAKPSPYYHNLLFSVADGGNTDDTAPPLGAYKWRCGNHTAEPQQSTTAYRRFRRSVLPRSAVSCGMWPDAANATALHCTLAF